MLITVPTERDDADEGPVAIVTGLQEFHRANALCNREDLLVPVSVISPPEVRCR